MHEEELNKIATKLDAISEAVTELRSMWPHMCRRLEHLENEVYGGNGRIGLANRVQTIYMLGVWATGALGTVVGGVVIWLLIGRFNM